MTRIIVNGRSYLYVDILNQLPREVLDNIDPRDYDTPEAWWLDYSRRYQRHEIYSPEWLLSILPSASELP